MPAYEVVLLLQNMAREGLKDALKRSAKCVFEVGGTLRKLENLGQRPLPYFIKANGKTHVMANCFVMNLDAGVPEMATMMEKIRLDVDVVRASYWIQYKSVLDRHRERKAPECTSEEDMLPPPYRQKVIEIQKLGEKKYRQRITHKNYDDTDFLIF